MDRDKDHNVITGGCNKNIGNRHEVYNYSGLSREDLIVMIEDRFRFLQQKENEILRKDSRIDQIWEENRILTEEVIRQNADFRLYNAAYAKQMNRITELINRVAELTDKLLEKK